MTRLAPRSLLIASIAIGRLCAQPSAEALQFFESKVRPIFASQCYGCHSSKSRIASGGLKLDTRTGFFQADSQVRPSCLDSLAKACWFMQFSTPPD